MLSLICIAFLALSSASVEHSAYYEKVKQKSEPAPSDNAGITWIANWRDSNVLRTPGEQGECGSCGYFSSTHTANDWWNIASKQHQPDLSIQDLIDCCEGQGCGGCHGSVPGAPGERGTLPAIYSAGVCTADCHGYQETDTFQCRRNCDNRTPVPMRWRSTGQRSYYRSVDIQEAVSMLAKTGPLVMTIDVPEDFMQFRGPGLYIPPANFESMGGHGVELVGAGTQEYQGQQVNFWYIKNSWSVRWGDGGYGRFLLTEGSRCMWIHDPNQYGSGCFAPADACCSKLSGVDDEAKWEQDGRIIKEDQLLVVGGWKQVNTTNEWANEAARFAFSAAQSKNLITESTFSLCAAHRQVVSGLRFQLDLLLGSGPCSSALDLGHGKKTTAFNGHCLLEY